MGIARDLDVFLAETIAPIRQRFPDLPALTALIDTTEERRLAARHHAHLTLDQARYNRLLLTVYRWLATEAWRRNSATASLGGSASDFADRLLKKQHKKMRHLGQDGAVREEHLHELRVLGKKMRYLGEAFRAFYKPKSFRKYHLHLASIQDCLGGLNDAFVGDRLMAELTADLSARGKVTPEDLAHLRGLVAGWQASRIDDGVQRFKEQWHDFRKADAYWTRD
jgi:CHAD domain-containing protein